MQIKKDYHFFAAHRNQDLNDKCNNLHGHSYFISFFFNVTRKNNSNITTLFGDFDDKIKPYLKKYDHGMVVDINDPFYKEISKGKFKWFKFKKINRPTSVENLCFEFFKEITRMGLDLDKIELKETTTSTVLYTKDDFNLDQELFENGN